jgi:BirA family biotin operon repressor/biotin-[acetyl-CoA-carboxylase] ligase
MDRFGGFSKGLKNSWGSNFIFLDETDSTNNYIMSRELAAGTVVAAACQTAGRGRGGRVWRSPQGSLAFSIALPPVDKKLLSGIQIAAAYAAVDALLDYADIRIKWPNDLLCGGKKIAGILLETVFAGNTPSKLALGIGLNVFNSPPDIDTAANLSAHCPELPPMGSIMADIVNSLEKRFGEYLKTADIQDDWPLYSAFFGKTISFHCRGKLISGIEKGITQEGYIIVENNGVDEIYNDFS